MLLPLDSVKTMLGIPLSDTTWDARLTNAGEAITRLMEAYCSRGFEFVAGEVEEFPRFYDERVYLRRFPIEALTSVTVAGVAYAPADLRMSAPWGWIERLDGLPLWGDVVVTADLGYPGDEVPADLAQAFALACGQQSGYGTGTVGGSAGTAPIKSLGLGQGAISIGFDTSPQLGLSGTYDVGQVPLMLQPMADVLQF